MARPAIVEGDLMTKPVQEAEAGSIAGYDYGQPRIARSPVTIDEMRQLEATVGWSAEDSEVLQRHADLSIWSIRGGR